MLVIKYSNSARLNSFLDNKQNTINWLINYTFLLKRSVLGVENVRDGGEKWKS